MEPPQLAKYMYTSPESDVGERESKREKEKVRENEVDDFLDAGKNRRFAPFGNLHLPTTYPLAPRCC